ncbi:MAG: hypothetical protein A2V86_03535 [Deltaproteobacteria bacterium RBG_16_49_23]|nr:MAG: hypothetical protein A2V86_03535 [Deltaproteobacteria bacterium RBG_16_49_23]
MMIFPRGEVVHKNLSTVYTDLSALFATLKLENFCGAIEIDFPKGRGFLFIDSGEIINGEIRTGVDSERVIGQEAIQTLLDFSKQKDGVISIYRLLPEQVALIARNLNFEALFKDLSTHFVHLDQFLLKLKEEKHTGFIEVMTKEHHPMGVLFIEGGEPVEMFTTPKTGPSVFGRMSIPIFIENAAQHRAFFNVYGKKGEPPLVGEVVSDQKGEVLVGGNGAEPAEREDGWKEILLLFQEFLSSSERLVDSLSSGGTFKKAFKTALIERSEEFGFLDPFAGEFEYKNGTILFTGEAGRKDFAKGIIECFRSTLSHFEEALPRERMVPLKLKAGIESFVEHRREALKRLDIEGIISSLTK